MTEPELHLGADVLVPDLAGWRLERASAEDYPSIAPDWAGEVLSPGTEALDRGPKMGAYGHHGVPWVWLVDPAERTLEAYRNDAGTLRPAGRWQGPVKVRVAPFAEIELDRAEVW